AEGRLPPPRHAIRHRASRALRRDRDPAPAISPRTGRGAGKRSLFPCRGARRRSRLIAFAVEHADIVDRVLERRERWARGEHPAAEDAPVEDGVGPSLPQLVDLQEGRALRLLLGWMLDAGPRRDDEPAEMHGLAHGRIEAADARRRLV